MTEITATCLRNRIVVCALISQFFAGFRTTRDPARNYEMPAQLTDSQLAALGLDRADLTRSTSSC